MIRWKSIVFVMAFLLSLYGCGKKEELVEPMTDSAEETTTATDAGSEESGAAEESAGEAGEKVNINTADAAALSTVPGIGDKMAEAIVAYREEKGNFKSIEDMRGNIKGVGEKTFEKMKDHITVEGGVAHGAAAVSEGGVEEKSGEEKTEGRRHRTSKKEPPAGKVNLNTASAEELATIPGIGPKMAEAILEYRKTKGNFKSVEELKGNVKGIGEKKFEKMKPYLTVK